MPSRAPDDRRRPASARPLRQQVEEEAGALRRRAGDSRLPEVAVIADAGLALAAPGEEEDEDALLGEAATRLPFGETLPATGYEREGGEGLRLGQLEGVPVALMQARHLGHGFTAQEAALPVRVLALLGARAFVLLGTAVGLRPRLQPGALLLLTDHLNLQGANPLTGANVDDWGPRFPDMTAPYDAGWRAAVRGSGGGLHPPPREGVYAAVPGPAPATPAEQAMLRRMGADAAGAGLVPEVLAARHMDRRVLAAAAIVEPHAAGGQRAEEAKRQTGSPGEGLADLVRVAVRRAREAATA